MELHSCVDAQKHLSARAGIGEKTERKIWENGVHRWEDFLKNKDVPGLGEKRIEKVSEYLEKSRSSLEQKDFDFLIQNLPKGIHWRTYKELNERVDAASWI